MKILYWFTILINKLKESWAFAKRVVSGEKAVVADIKEASGRIAIEEVKAEGQITIGTEVDNQKASEIERSEVNKKGQTWGKVAQRTALTVVVLLLLILISGTTFAFAQPKHAFASPFKGIAIALTDTSYDAVGLIENVRYVVAGYERNIISTALQSMKVTEDLDTIPEVSVPTNDMACFPSAEHRLFPDYLDSRFSQFKYTIDYYGIVQVDTSGATTDAFLKRINKLLYRFAE